MARADMKNREFICDFCNEKFIGYKYLGHRTHCPQRPKGRGHTKTSLKKAVATRRRPKNGRRKPRIKAGRRERTTQTAGLSVAVKSIKGQIRLVSAKTAYLRQQIKAAEQKRVSLTKALKYLS